MRRNFIDTPPEAKVDQSGPSFLQKLHLGHVPEPHFFWGTIPYFFSLRMGRFCRASEPSEALLPTFLTTCPHFQRSAHISNEAAKLAPPP